MMIVKNILPRALERLAVIEAQAPVREAAALMSKPHTDLIVVCDHGDIVGVLTKTDIVGQIGRCMGAGCTARVDSIMILLLIALFRHTALCLQVVIEDYVHSGARFAAVIAIQLCCYGLALVGVIATLRIALGG